MNWKRYYNHTKIRIKPFLYKVGIFSPIRNLYRRVSKHHRLQKRYNSDFYQLFLHPQELCFDIGANLGQTIEAIIDNECRVISVEPNPKCFDVLASQYNKNPLVSIERLAMGSEEGTATLNFQGTESTASLREDWPYQTNDSTETKVSTLDKLIEKYGIPSLIKVDVEGFEYEVFKGLTQPVNYLVFEVHRLESDTADRILQHIESIGPIVGIKIMNGDLSKWIIDRWSNPNSLQGIWQDSGTNYVNLVVKMQV